MKRRSDESDGHDLLIHLQTPASSTSTTSAAIQAVVCRVCNFNLSPGLGRCVEDVEA
jgi:hypothetical protein